MIEFEQYRLDLAAMEDDIKELFEALGIVKDEAEVRSLEKLTLNPEFYNDIEESQKVLQKIKQLKSKIDSFYSLKQEWEDAVTLVTLAIDEQDSSVYDEVVSITADLKKRIENTKIEALLSGPYDRKNAILTIHAGAGGTEGPRIGPKCFFVCTSVLLQGAALRFQHLITLQVTRPELKA